MERERRGLEPPRALVEGGVHCAHQAQARVRSGHVPSVVRRVQEAHIVWAKGAKSGTKPKLHPSSCPCRSSGVGLWNRRVHARRGRRPRDSAVARRGGGGARGEEGRRRKRNPGPTFSEAVPTPCARCAARRGADRDVPSRQEADREPRRRPRGASRWCRRGRRGREQPVGHAAGQRRGGRRPRHDRPGAAPRASRWRGARRWCDRRPHGRRRRRTAARDACDPADERRRKLSTSG